MRQVTRPGLRTTEFTVVGLLGSAIVLIASSDPEAAPVAQVRSAGCWALALVAAAYCLARSWAKRE